MSRFGFIHGKLDIKLLILYIMDGVAAPIDFATLTDLSLCDDGVDYFVYAEAVAELLESGHLAQDGEYYSITEKGRRTCVDTENSLSSVIRNRCDQRLAPLNQALKRMSQIRGEVISRPEKGEFIVQLSFEDDAASLFSLSLLVGTQEEGERIAAFFKEHPNRVYNGILGVLMNRQDPS